MKTERKSFVMYMNFANQFKLLSMEERGQLITAIFDYVKDGGNTVDLPPLVYMAFSCMKDDLDRDLAAYAAKCEQNAKNGKKGGRPRKQTFLTETDWFAEKTKKAYNDNDNGNDNDNNNDNDNVNGNGNDMEYKARESGQGIAPPVPSPRSAELCEEEREELIAKGIPADYISERAVRAASYGNTHGKGAFQVLLDWWHDDRARTPWNLSQSRHTHRPGTGSAERNEREKRQEEYGQSHSTEAFDWGEWRNKTPEEMLDDDFGRAALRWYDKLDAAEAVGVS